MALTPRKLFKMASSSFAKKKYEQALHQCDQLLSTQPNHAGALNMKGKLMMYLGEPELAHQLFRRASQLEPQNSENYKHMARILSDMDKSQEAIAMIEKARSFAPKDMEIHGLLAAFLIKFNRAHYVPNYLEDIFAKVGEDANLMQLYCTALQMDNRAEEAQAAYKRLIDKYTVDGSFRMMFELHLSRLLLSNEQIDSERKQFAEAMDSFIKEKPKANLSMMPLIPLFNLAYHNKDSKELASKYCKMLRLCADEVKYVAPHLKAGNKPDPTPDKIKIGFASRYMHDHPVGRCYNNILFALHEHGGFDVTLFMLGNVVDKSIERMKQAGINVVGTHKKLETTQNIIASHELDILIFPDIGMEAMSYYLAMSKLAHYQCCLTGHPDTTGIDTLDYFISAGVYEPENGQDNYTETLLRAHGIDTVFTKFNPPEKWLTRADFDLPEDKKLYLVPMAIQKLHPDFDDILADILEQDNNALIILFEDFQRKSATEQLRKRILNKCDENRILFMQWQPLDSLISLLKISDAVLSTIYFGAGTTSQIAFSFGVPLVSWPDWHARSRMVHGYYKFMGIENPPSATSADDYVKVAMRIANDVDYRKNISQQILQKHDILYENDGYKKGFAKMMQDIMAQNLEDYIE